MGAAEEFKPVYFDSSKMGEADLSYVCWFDVMGTRNHMLRSLSASANFIFKLHCAVLESFDALDSTDGVALYPAMDGVYISSARRGPLVGLLRLSLRRLAETFLAEEEMQHRFLVRGAIAFGPVVHGQSVQKEAAWVLTKHPRVRDSIIMGVPMVQAYSAEPDAPPYGIAIEPSARAFAPEGDKPFPFIWWDWFSAATPPLDVGNMLQALREYFDWHRSHIHTTGYDLKRIEHHEQLAIEYFTK